MVWAMMFDEMFELIRGKFEQQEVISQRKESYMKYTQYPAFPNVIMGRFIPDEWINSLSKRNDYYIAGCENGTDMNYDSTSAKQTEADSLPVIIGFAGAAGTVEGIVRVITDIGDINQLEKGEILVTTATYIGAPLLSMPFLFCMFSPFKKCSFLVKKILLIKQCIDSFLFFFHEFFPFF